MNEHLKAEELESILEQLRDGAVRHVLAHVTECQACRRMLQAALVRRSSASRMLTSQILPFDRLGADGSGSDGEDPLGARLQTWLARVELCARREQTRAPAEVEELLSQPSARRRVLVRNTARFHTWAVAARLLEAGTRAGFEDVAEAEDLARLALEVICKLDPEEYGERLILDLQARAWGAVANALRQQSRLPEAEEAFERSLECLEGSADPLEWARHLDLRTSYFRHRMEHGKALESAREAATLYLEAGQRERVPAMRAMEGLVHLERGAPEEALAPLEEAHQALDAERQPRLAMVVYQNLAVALIEMGRHVEAHRVFTRARPLYDRFQDRYTVLRRRWLESLLAAGSDDADRAVELFLEVRNGYVEAGLELEAAEVSLDLARLWAAQGRWPELRRLAAEMAPIFASKSFEPQVLVALAFFRRAVEEETATTALVRRVGTFLRRSRQQPNLTFEPAAGS